MGNIEERNFQGKADKNHAEFQSRSTAEREQDTEATSDNRKN